MGFFSFFFGSAEPDSQFNRDLHAAAADGLDIQTAIIAHQNWKLRLEAYLDGTSKEDFSPEVVCFDDRCDLGKWIHGSGQARLGRYPGFTALQGHHKMFHYAASNVVALSKAGKHAEAQKMLYSQFDSFSGSVVRDLESLQTMLEQSKR